jgi:hypothetical protein
MSLRAMPLRLWLFKLIEPAGSGTLQVGELLNLDRWAVDGFLRNSQAFRPYEMRSSPPTWTDFARSQAK